MPSSRIDLALPVSAPLKKKAKQKIIEQMISAFKKKDVQDVVVSFSHYVDKRASTEPLLIVLTILTATADIATIATAIYTFLKDYSPQKEINLSIGDMKLKIKGSMSDEEIVKLVREAGKIAKKKKQS